MTQGTGKYDCSGNEMMVGDVVHFRCKKAALSGRGVVFMADEADSLGSDLFRIRDTRPGKNCGRIYPYYGDAKYRIEVSVMARNKQKINEWLDSHDGEDYCGYCICCCENRSTTAGPDGPIFPPCADWDDEEMIEHLDTEAILNDMEMEDE